jgi:hypothetical protein
VGVRQKPTQDFRQLYTIRERRGKDDVRELRMQWMGYPDTKEDTTSN